MKRLLEAKADFDRMVNILIDYDLADSNEALSLVNKFKGFRDRNLIKGQDRDISTWYNRPVEFIDFIEDLESKKSKTQKNKQAKEGAELVAENNEWKVYKIDTWEASCFYGKGTKWCTAGKDSRYFNSYKDRGAVLYYIISDSEKYAIALYPEILDILYEEYGIKTNFELYDERDNIIINKEELENILNKFPKIPNVKLILKFLPVEIKDNVLIKVYPYNSGEFIIPDGITSIGTYAFYNCNSLTSITIPDSVTSIGDRAFYNCSSLTSITIPDSVTSIGDRAFLNCHSLTSITIPKSVTSIGDGAFQNCSALTSVTIPNSITSINNYVFYGCSSLTSIIIPKSVTSIGSDTFSNCKSLTSITIPDSVTSIGAYAFYNCNSLTSITIPKSVISIGVYAFYGCRSLTSITIPDSVTSIGAFAFYDCNNLTIYAEAKSKPKMWHRVWAPGDIPVIWGYKQTKNLKEAKADFDRMVNILIDYDLANSDEAILLINKFKGFRDRNLINSRDRDISTWYNRPVEFIDFIEDLENKKSKTQKNKQAKEGAELVAKNNEWKVYKIETYTASCLYGKGTKWCTAGNNPEYFNKYKKRGIVLYYVISDNKKYAIALYPEIVDALQKYGIITNFELFNENDNRIIDKEELENVLNKFPKIPNVELILEFLPAEIKDNVLIKVYPYNSGEFIIPDSVTSIGSDAFQNCSAITSITIPNSVTSIGNSAFYNCSSLTNIIIPDSVISIGDNAFSSCKSLTSITIPKSVTSIGNHTFSNCSSLTSIIIPDSVTSIGNFTFTNCRHLTSITIPDSVTSIGAFAFGHCGSLTNIIIPKSVTSIGDYAFSYCGSLTNIVIPDSVTSIGSHAFSNCSSLTSIIIPKSVTRIGSYVFLGCFNLTIYAEAESKPEEWHKAWTPSYTSVIWGYKQIKNLEEDMTMRGLRFSGSGHLYSYRQNSKIAVKGSNTIIEAKADFDRMVNILIDYDLADSNEAVSLVNKFKSFRDRNLISGQDKDISTWYSRPVEFIDFIEDLENKKSKTELAKLAKEGAELVAENNEWKVYRIYTHAASCFYGKGTKWCTAGKNPEYFDNYKERGIVLYYIISDNKKYAIALYPEIVNTLQEEYGIRTNFELFDEEDNRIINKEELEGVLNKFPKIPYAGLILEFLPVEIWGKVLINVPRYNSGEFIVPDSVTSIASYAFEGCSSLTSITIPDSVTSIGSYVFRGCSSLTSITIPDSVTSIGNGVFSGCSSLTSITIPDSVTSIGSYIFEDCSSLTSVTIPDSVTSIGGGAFQYCSELTSITIPNSVTSIGNGAFLKCTELTSITIPNSVTSIGDHVFYGCSSLTSVTIPDSVTSIGNDAFYNCSALTSITIPNSVTSIGNNAFCGCSSLTSITIPDSVTSIGSYAFLRCYNLTIYAEAESKPEEWHRAWAPANMPVIWGYKRIKNLKEGMTMRGSRFLKESMKLTVFEIETKIINFFKEKGITVTVSREEDAFKVFLPRHINVKKQTNITEELRKLINELFSQDNMSAIVDETPFGFIIHPTLGIHNFKLFEDKRVSGKDKKKCAICKTTIDGLGNDPWPIDVGITSRVCDACNFEFVIPARLNLLKNKKKIKEASNPTKHEIEKEASNVVLDNKFIWLFSVLSEDGIDIAEGIEYLNDAIDVLINKNGAYLVAFPYVDPNPEDLSVDLVFADNPGPIIIYNREEATVPKDKLHKPTNIKQPKDNLTQEEE